MEGTRFDNFARSIAGPRSRRQFLKTLAGGVGGGLLGVLGAGQTSAKPGCRNAGHPCEGNQTCCGGLVCIASGPGAVDRCTDGCLIDGVFYAPGVTAPDTPCLICAPEVSTTAWTPNDGALCDDGDACTQPDTCQGGVCVGGNPVDCAALDQCHDAGQCVPLTGTCSNPNKMNGVSCNDENACTSGDSCQGGVCTGGTPLACTTGNPCLIASCDPDRGCVSTPKGEGVSCADADTCDGAEACDGEGHCVDGTPVTCGECTVCDAVSGTCQPANDNDPCTPPPSANLCFTGWVCGAGQCLHQYETACLAEDECHTAGSCDPATGLCSFVDAADDTPCDVTNKCILDRTCLAGVCSGGFYRDPCGLSLDFCGTGGHCDPATGTCVDREPVNEGTECTNIIADACTVAQKCQGGVCTNIYQEGSPCSGGITDACTVEQQCLGGVCTNVQKDCSEADVPGTCYAGVCDPDSGDCRSSQALKPINARCEFVNECGGTESGYCTGLDEICHQSQRCWATDPFDSREAYVTCEILDDGSVARCGKTVYHPEGHACTSDGMVCRDVDDGTGRTECGCDGVRCEPHEICCTSVLVNPYCFPRLGTPLCPF